MPITISDDDQLTDETARNILTANEAYDEACPPYKERKCYYNGIEISKEACG